MKLLTVSQAADALGLSTQTVRSIPHDKLPHIRTHGGQRRYRLEDVRVYSKRCEVTHKEEQNCGVSFLDAKKDYATLELRDGCIVLALPTMQLWFKAAATITQIMNVISFDPNGYITVETNDGEEYINPYGVGELLGIPEETVKAEMAKVKSVIIVR